MASSTHALGVPFRIRLDAVAACRDWEYRWDASLAEAATDQTEVGAIGRALCYCGGRTDRHGPAEVNRLSRMDSVTVLLPHAYCFTMDDPDRKRLMMRRYIELARRVPTFAVTMAESGWRSTGRTR